MKSSLTRKLMPWLIDTPTHRNICPGRKPFFTGILSSLDLEHFLSYSAPHKRWIIHYVWEVMVSYIQKDLSETTYAYNRRCQFCNSTSHVAYASRPGSRTWNSSMLATFQFHFTWVCVVRHRYSLLMSFRDFLWTVLTIVYHSNHGHK